MLPFLSKDSPFPHPSKALKEPNGLLAFGADLSPRRLLLAYQNGIFPWFSEGEPLLWWSPDPRTVFFIEHFKIHKSVIKTIRQKSLTVTLNSAFDQVIYNCSLARSAENGVWITPPMIEAYSQLHQMGKAHSVEVWRDQELVGGIYGVDVGSVFCGESMFSRISNGSKIALSSLVYFLKPYGYKLIDCQVENPHLVSLGSTNIARDVYLDLLHSPRTKALTNDFWSAKPLLPEKLFAKM